MARSKWADPAPRSIRLVDATGPVFGMVVLVLGGLLVPTSTFGWCATAAAMIALPLTVLRARALLAGERFVTAPVTDRYRVLGGLLDELGPGQQRLITGGGLVLAVNEKTTTGSSLRQYVRLDHTRETTATGGHIYDEYTLDTDRPVVHHRLRVTGAEDGAEGPTKANLRRRPVRTTWTVLKLDAQLTRTGIDLVGVDELDVLIAQVQEGIASR